MGATEKGDKNDHVLGGTAIRPKDKSFFQSWIYDGEAGTVLTRTPKSWFLILGFYMIYYTFLCGFWALMFFAFSTTLSNDSPKWQAAESLIGTNPGLGIRPSQTEGNIDSALFFLDQNFDGVGAGSIDDDGSIGYATRMQDYFRGYQDNDNNPNATLCSGDEPNQAEEGKFCRFVLDDLGECRDFPYGFGNTDGKASPCVFIKMNRIFSLVPEPIANDGDFAEGADEDMKQKIKSAGFPKKIFIGCKGEYPADREVLEGNISYYPQDGSVSLKYFPMKSKYQNENAMVAVKFKELPVNRLVHVVCKAYYKGVEYSKKHKIGMVTFQFLVNGQN